MNTSKCKYCNYENEREQVLQHENDKHERNNCISCNKRIDTTQQRVQHEISKHEKIICTICYKDFTSTKNAKLALKNHKKAKKYKYHVPPTKYDPDLDSLGVGFVETYDPRDAIEGYYD